MIKGWGGGLSLPNPFGNFAYEQADDAVRYDAIWWSDFCVRSNPTELRKPGWSTALDRKKDTNKFSSYFLVVFLHAVFVLPFVVK